MSHINQISDADFEQEVLKSELPVLVDFWAEWCAPCKAIAPNLQAIAEEYQGKVKVVKIDVDKNPESPMKYAVRGIPTLIMFDEGELKKLTAGMASKQEIADFIESAL